MDNALLPLGILMIGVAALAAFIAFRPWPLPGGTSIKPGAYVLDILQGNPPAASNPPDRTTDINIIEGGILALIAIWAAGKIAGLLSPFLPGGGGGGGGEGGEDEPTEEPPTEEPPPEEPAPVEPDIPDIPLAAGNPTSSFPSIAPGGAITPGSGTSFGA